MARKMLKDTFAVESVAGTEIRRLVFAGHIVPDSYQLEEGSYEEVEGGVTSFGPEQERPEDTKSEEDDEPEAPRPSRTRKK